MTLDELRPYIIEEIVRSYRRNRGKSNSPSTVRYYRAKCITESCENETMTRCTAIHKASGLCRTCTARKRPFDWALSSINKRNKVERFKGCTISYSEILDLMIVNKCEYCGCEIKRPPYHIKNKGNSLFLDRKANDIGYTYDNLVTCCWPCNERKGKHYSYDEFKAIMKLLINNFGWPNDFLLNISSIK